MLPDFGFIPFGGAPIDGCLTRDHSTALCVIFELAPSQNGFAIRTCNLPLGAGIGFMFLSHD